MITTQRQFVEANEKAEYRYVKFLGVWLLVPRGEMEIVAGLIDIDELAITYTKSSGLLWVKPKCEEG